jgi:hypothetical protein
MTRTLEARVSDYRDNLWSLADQLEALVKRLPNASGVAELTDSARLYRLIANDLAVLVAGEELSPFRITGTIPPLDGGLTP